MREHALRNEATKVEIEMYTRNLTEGEIALAKDRFAALSMRKSQMEEEKKERVKEMNDEIKRVGKEAKDQLLRAIQRWETVTGKVYYIPNFEDGVMEMYDAEGELIHSRKLHPEERQLTIDGSLKAVK